MPTAAIIDVDGTLVDSNYQHALAWYEAFRQSGIVLPVWRIHRLIGMGGDQLVPTLIGDEKAEEVGEDVKDAEKPLYKAMMDQVEPLDGARELIDALKEDGRTVVLASSGKADEVDHYIDLLGVREVVDGWTTSADVEQSKPEPDLIEAALEKAGARDAVMIGDSTWDVRGAKNAGLETIGVLTGGFAESELRDEGAVAVFESLPSLRERRANTPLG